MYQRVFYGEMTNEKNKNLPDCTALEKLMLTTVVIVIIAMGIYPQPFLRRMDRSVEAVMARVDRTGYRKQVTGYRFPVPCNLFPVTCNLPSGGGR